MDDKLRYQQGIARRREVLGPEPEAPPPYSMDWSEPQGEERLWQAGLRHLLPRPLTPPWLPELPPQQRRMPRQQKRSLISLPPSVIPMI